ncbi:MAG: acetyl-CoA carboxylase carboxyltransferase subunit beta [Rhodothermales bacterium]|nr:acetyl-CoA carboxylase carboxyltransferase subunit beta [Rhodothermales bacterium]MBO6780554.1 acetyl-CoA carboxylase carboxyltransferase subunit beta [Rhodothermales bacterium]
MAWFRRTKAGINTELNDQIDVPEGQWIKCNSCGSTLNRREVLRNHQVCSECGHHFSMSSLDYYRLLFDNGEFELADDNIVSKDPLEFTDRKPYSRRLTEAQRKSGLMDAATAAVGNIGGHRTSVTAMDFKFIGGSMGSVVGEVISRAIKRAYTEEMPLIIITQSGGARMMEGALSLMQLAKTSAHLTRLHEKGLPFIVILANPTTGGVTASFAMLGDVHLAEPGALIGFAGPRVIRETMGQDLPEGFQRSEFLKEHGFVDQIVPRSEMKQRIADLFDLLLEKEA